MEEDWRKRLQRQLEKIPKDWMQAVEQAQEIDQVFREKLGAAMAPLIYEHMRTWIPMTLEERRAACGEMNQQLRELGLQAIDPATRREVNIQIQGAWHRPGAGRFVLVAKHQEPGEQQSKVLQTNPEPIRVELVPRAARMEAGSRLWQDQHDPVRVRKDQGPAR